MKAEKIQFIQHGFTALVQQLNPQAAGSWGKMNAQQMVEHVTAFVHVSTGKIKFPVLTPQEQLPRYREFLMSEKPFRENTKAPGEVLGDEPMPLHHSSMAAAIAALQQSIDEFFTLFAAESGQTTSHPVFGELHFAEWIQLHHKHMTHHARQFGLLPVLPEAIQ